MWRDVKYLIAYIAPLAAYLGIYLQGAWSFGSIYIGFVLIPLLEFFTPQSIENVSPEEEPLLGLIFFFDFLLYSTFPSSLGFSSIISTPFAAGGLATL